MSEYLTKLRCFRRVRDVEKNPCRHGMWVMDRRNTGVFFHGDHDEIQAPRYTVDELETLSSNDGTDWFKTEEISPQQVLSELEGWPYAQSVMHRLIAAHLERSVDTGCEQRR